MVERTIKAIRFAVEADDGKVFELIAWLEQDGNGKHLKPSHPDHSLLDVRVGDRVTYMRRKVVTVRSIRPWRTSECKDDTQYTDISCGRDWEAGKS